MAVIIGRSKSWLWWLAGFLCALVFGRGAGGAEAVAKYGVEAPGPGFVAPAVPRPPPPSENFKQRASQLIDEYLAGGSPAPTGADLKARIDKLVKDLGADEWAARENASKELLAIGKPALPALKEAAKSKDAEVASRAKDLIEKVEGSGSPLEGLRALGPAGQAAVQERLAAERKAMTGSAGAAGEAELAGKKDEAEKLRAEAKRAQANAAALTKLLGLLAQAPAAPAPGPGPVQALYGVRVRIEKD